MPEALNCGIDFQSFWELTPKHLNMLIKAVAEKQADEMDVQAWRSGMYVAFAVGSAIGGSQYPEYPFSMEENDEEEGKEDEIASLKFKAWADAFNKTKGATDE